MQKTLPQLPKHLTREEVSPYREGLRFLLETGRLVPKATGNRVTLYAIILADALGIEIPGNADMANAMVHKVLSVGPDVRSLQVGDHCIHISTAGDTALGDKTDRFVSASEEDVIWYWNYKDIEGGAAVGSPILT